MINKLKSKLYNLLRKSEKYTKTDMMYFTHGSFWLTLGQTISSASSFLLALAFANFLPKETFGVYKYVLSIVGILTITTLPGISTTVTQAIARGYEGSFLPAIKTKIRWGVFGSLTSLVLAGYYYFQGNIDLTFSFLIVAVFLPLMDTFMLYDSLLSGKKLFSISTKYGIISQIVATVITASALFFTGNLFVILLAYFASWTILRYIFLKITLKKFRLNNEEDSKTISYGKHLSFIGIIGNIATYLDRLLIFHYLGAAEVAIYSIAIAPIDQIKNLFKNIPTLAMPKLAQRSFKEIDAILYKRLFYLFLTGLIIAVTYFALAPLFFKLFFPKYLESVFYSRLFSLSIVLNAMLSFLNVVGNSKITKTPKKMVYQPTVIIHTILIVSLLILTPQLGTSGVVFSRLIFLFSTIVISIIYWKKVYKFNLTLSSF